MSRKMCCLYQVVKRGWMSFESMDSKLYYDNLSILNWSGSLNFFCEQSSLFNTICYFDEGDSSFWNCMWMGSCNLSTLNQSFLKRFLWYGSLLHNVWLSSVFFSSFLRHQNQPKMSLLELSKADARASFEQLDNALTQSSSYTVHRMCQRLGKSMDSVILKWGLSL